MEEYRDVYESNRVELVRNLRIDRTLVLDYLRSKKVIDKGDCELILAEKTSERKAGKLLDILGHAGKDGFDCFTEALQLESPQLYEMLTGKDAGSTPNPILMKYHNSRQGKAAGMEDVEMELLTEHLSRSYAELQRISTQYNAIVKEKRKLEGQLVMNEADLQRKKDQLIAWEQRFYKEKTCSINKQNKAQKWMHTMAFENEQGLATIKYLESEASQLKMKLLHANEEIESLRTSLNNANAKKNQEQRYRREMGESYEKERKQSARLSIKIKCQEDELQVLDGYKRQCEDLELRNAELKDDNEKQQQEFNELVKWTKSLKDRFDAIENDNIRTKETSQSAAENIKVLQNEIKQLKKKSSYFEVENEFLKYRVTFLEKDCQIYKQQRDKAMISRQEAAQERDRVWSDRELAWHHYMEILKARDSEVERKESCMQELDAMENRFNETVSELAKTKLKVNEMKLMVEDMQEKLNDKQRAEEENDKNSESSVPVEQDTKDESDESQEPIQRHSRRKLIQSLRRRVNKTPGDNGDYSGSFNGIHWSQRTASRGLLMLYLSDFDEQDERDEISSCNIRKWASCPHLEEVDEQDPYCAKASAAKYSSLPDLYSFDQEEEEMENGAQDETDETSQEEVVNLPLPSSVKQNISPKKEPFRIRSNDMSTRQPLARSSSLRRKALNANRTMFQHINPFNNLKVFRKTQDP